MNRNQELQELQDRWQTSNQQMLAMKKEHDIATHSDRKFELEQKIKEKESLLENLQQQIQQLHDEEKLDKLRTNLFQQKRNGHFGEAIKTAEVILAANPAEPRIEKEISQLKEKEIFYQQALQVLGELGTRISELEMDFYLELIEKLHPKNRNDDLIILLTPITRQFIDKEIDAEDYQQICRAQIANAGNRSTVDTHVNHAELRQKIINGDTVLFLGAELINFYDREFKNETDLAQQLAKDIDYETFQGNLSAIAELIQTRQGGKKDLLNNLYQSLPQTNQRYRFYQSLAENAEQHLIIVSSAYDRLLEEAFINSGKPFVEISSIINRTQNYDIGHVVLNYSDQDKEETKPQEELSALNLLENYTIIYKIRGTCMDANNKHLTARKDALTLSEDNYLTFAENARKMIPNVLAEHLREREILFVGFSPKSWEERLLVRTLLKHRYNSDYLCLRMQDNEKPDLIETAFWEKQNIKSTDIDFYALDDYLQGATS